MKTIDDIRKTLQSTSSVTIDISTPAGTFINDLLHILSEYESAVKEQRRLDHIESTRLYGTKLGRRSKMDEKAIKEALLLKKEGYTNNQIAQEFDVGRSTLLRYLAEYKVS